jgi:hypothetical protein
MLNSAVCIVTGLGEVWPRNLIRFRRGARNTSNSKLSYCSGVIQPSNRRVVKAISSIIKRSMFEADISPASSAEVKNGWIYNSTPPRALMA